MEDLKNSEGNSYGLGKYKIRKIQKDIVIKKLIKQGFKITRQRLILLDIILSEECSSCKEIHYKVAKLNKHIGIATIYRMINILESIGVVSKDIMYKFTGDDSAEVSNVYEVRIDDDTVYKLSVDEWNNVVRAGLNACGYIGNQNSALSRKEL